ncbi:hypothetical protein [Chitinophaga sancti]|uniref:Uncharacterized protein n=1 Tax=Chitinophaga sancti TaxID=1004 RepID=A0A1K1SPU0_9BACT|nr:hypothetical protein [Chitinophaga sancti]WQD60039.1 hypothetical protein U0033_19300 [Chitinophaga sancti]WQG87831.1 hypothetical protein SR876_23165 [Chitinophaga sancti]SFW85885.1 hypothetical protein SAMN05661012_05810 [Chitinophaga sancti]
MITAYHIIASENIDFPVDLTMDFSKGMPEMEQAERFKYFNSHSKGIKWYTGEDEHIIYEEGQNIHGLITPDFKKFVAVYQYNHPEFNSPSNVVIYNEDKTIHMRVPLVCPVSAKNIESDSAFEGLYIGGVVWKRNQLGEIITALNLIFNREYVETRVFDYITGEIGACIGTYRL